MTLAVTGCGQAQAPGGTATAETAEMALEIQTEAGPVEEPAEEQAEEPQASAPGTGGYEDNFAVEEAVYQEYGRRIKDAVATEDLEALADLTAFPVYIGFEEGGQLAESREEFLALGSERIFTDGLLSSIAEADETALSPSMAGFVLQSGDGPNIIFGVTDGALGIVGINYGFS